MTGFFLLREALNKCWEEEATTLVVSCATIVGWTTQLAGLLCLRAQHHGPVACPKLRTHSCSSETPSPASAPPEQEERETGQKNCNHTAWISLVHCSYPTQSQTKGGGLKKTKKRSVLKREHLAWWMGQFRGIQLLGQVRVFMHAWIKKRKISVTQLQLLDCAAVMHC